MKFQIFTILGSAALADAALAHSGHIADAGQGHAHWLVYVLLGCALFGIAAWARTARSARASTKRRR